MILRRKISLFFLAIFFFSERSFCGEFNFQQHAKYTVEDGFDKTGIWILGVGSALTVLAFQLDSQTQGNWKSHQQISADISKYGDYWGTGIPQTIIFAGQTYFDPKNGIPAFEGLIAGGIVTHSAKLIVGRERPDSHTKTSMPSGHTQAAFSIAASMTESYGWKVGVPFWGLAVFTGLTRMADNAHWLSDVVAGATIGTFFGRAGYQHHRDIQPAVIFDNGKVDGAVFVLNLEW